ncbi:MAG: RsmB/NOP family class I SAM-dependent RNA methyltransferase [Hyphomicrobiaceae bacterium]
MKPGARLAGAVEVLDEVMQRHRPVANALSEWGKAHRFAGSGDRAAIGNLVYDVLRRKHSLAAQMGSDSARALVLAAAGRALALSPEAIALHADGSDHCLSPLTEDEIAGLTRTIDSTLPAFVRGDLPEWLMPSIERTFGASVVEQGQAMARRAPVDLRVNSMKTTREKALKALEQYGAVATKYAALGVRIAPPEGPGRTPNVEADAAHGKGWFEVQDEGSQIAAALSGAGPRQQVMDLCAGAGGKTLSLAAAMQNTGQIYAYDSDKGQLRPIFERLKRAGVRNAQVMNAGNIGELTALGARFDVVLVDAPCTGSGTWRRRPDAKWRVTPQNLEQRLADQREVLALARGLVKPGGRLVYVTCSILPEENTDQVTAFLGEAPEFAITPTAEAWQATLGGDAPASADGRTDTLLLTPASHGTDGFFIAVMRRGVA